MGECNFAGADWITQTLTYSKPVRVPSPFGRLVADILGQVYRGIYHIPEQTLLHPRTKWEHDRHIEVIVRNELATYDAPELTFLVVLCHEAGVRLSIHGANIGYLCLMFSKRSHTATSFATRHPRMEQALQNLAPYGLEANGKLPPRPTCLCKGRNTEWPVHTATGCGMTAALASGTDPRQTPPPPPVGA